MSSRGVFILMILTATIALAAVVQDYRFDGWVARERAAAAALATSPVADSDALNPIPGNDNALAQAASQRAIERRIVQLGQFRLALNGAAMVFVLGVSLYLGRVVATLRARGEPTTAQMLRGLPPPVKTGTTGTTGATGATGTTGTASTRGPVVVPVAPALAALSSLPAAAELCVDLAKVLEPSEIPALLERTATVLGARGLVIWAVDPDGARLRPSLSHGYSDKVLAKLRTIQVDADNVTAVAYRSLQPQTLNGASDTDPAAIAIPLLTGTGCVGVMSAELRHSRTHPDLLPLARILGAQFSTLITPSDDQQRSAAHA